MLQVNETWERQTGLRSTDFEGKRIREAMPNVEPVWAPTFAKVAKTGKSTRFESYNGSSCRWYDLYAFLFKKGQVGKIFRDITDRKKVQEKLTRSSLRISEILESISDDFMVLILTGIMCMQTVKPQNLLV